MIPPRVRVRFAPSPTGRIHLGNARTALFNWLLARSHGGSFILRIEDTDLDRNVEGAEAAILDDLRWLGLTWDEGPDRGGSHGPYRQSERERTHGEATARMLASGDAYRCFCSVERLESDREAQRREGLPPRYRGRCRSLSREDSDLRASAGDPFVVRLRVPEEGVAFEDLVRGRVSFPGEQLGDPILVRSDGRPAYNFAAVTDDVAMEVTHVLRGEDHISNTPIQILIYRALGATPPAFAHLSMILGQDGSRLSKREGSGALGAFREAGYLPEAMANYLALLGWSHPEAREVLELSDLVASFSLHRVSRSAAAFDPAKLLFLNARHLRSATPDRLLALARPFLESAGLRPGGEGGGEAAWWARALALASGQMETLAGAPAAMRLFFDPAGGVDGMPAPRAEDPGEAALMEAFESAAASVDLAAPGAFREWAKSAGAMSGRKGRALFHPLRVALTGAEQGPELDRLVPLLEEGSRLPLAPRVAPCLERIAARKAGLAGAARSRE